MRKIKICHQYFMSVEGYNEKWYFEHLQKLINSSEESEYVVNFDIKLDKSPISRMKSIVRPVFSQQKLVVFHIIDYESNDDVHQKQFFEVLDELKDIRCNYKNYNFNLGYSNFSFELWLLLHKDYNFSSCEHRKQYIEEINRVYGTNFDRMKDNKHKAPFDNLLAKINLSDVKGAVKNAKKIRTTQLKNGNTMVEYKGFSYFRENPDLTVNECVEQIILDCKIQIV